MNNIPISIPQAAVNAVLGYAVVFFGLILLMCVITIMGKVMAGRKAKQAAPAAPAAAKLEAPAVKPSAPPAPGTAGELKLYGTDPKTAAIIMAITADKLGTPLNELRFKSIKEVENK